MTDELMRKLNTAITNAFHEYEGQGRVDEGGDLSGSDLYVGFDVGYDVKYDSNSCIEQDFSKPQIVGVCFCVRKMESLYPQGFSSYWGVGDDGYHQPAKVYSEDVDRIDVTEEEAKILKHQFPPGTVIAEKVRTCMTALLL